MTAAAEALLTSHREPLAPTSGASFATRLVSGLAALRALAPYAAIELLLPGGSLIALVLWLYRRYKKATLVQADHGSHPTYARVAGDIASAGVGALPGGVA